MKRLGTLILLVVLCASGGTILTSCKTTGSSTNADSGVLGGSTGPRQPRYTRGQAIDADFYDQLYNGT